MGKRYIAADCHVGYFWPKSAYERIFQFQALLKPDDIVYLVGDSLEWAWLSAAEVRAHMHYERFMDTAAQYQWVQGNHDIGNGQECAQLWPEGVIMFHGHQFDRLADSAWKRAIYCLAPWVRDLWWSTPWCDKMKDSPKLELHNFAIRARAMEWLLESQWPTMVIGHTHSSCLVRHPWTGKLVVNIGSLPEDGVYGEIEGGNIALHKLDGVIDGRIE